MPFNVTIAGVAYSTNSLSLDEAERLESECGKTWLELNPIRSAKEFRATARVFLSREHDPGTIERIVQAFTIETAMEAVEWVDDDLPTVYEEGLPKAEGGHSTTTSSTSPGPPSNGRPTSPEGNGSGTSSSSSNPSTEAELTG